MSKRLISMILIVATLCSVLLTSCDISKLATSKGNAQNTPTTDTADEGAQTLQILKSNAKLTQDQLLSRIKAEYLITNGGYADSDPIVAIITLPGASLIDSYMSTSAVGSVSDYVHSVEGKAAEESILAEQSSLIDELYAEGLISGVAFTYKIL